MEEEKVKERLACTTADMQAVVAKQTDIVFENDLAEKLDKLVEEAGEARQAGFEYEGNSRSKDELDCFKDEVADVFWVVIALANEFGWSLEELFDHVATKNLTRFNDVIKDEYMAMGYDRIQAYQEAKKDRG